MHQGAIGHYLIGCDKTHPGIFSRYSGVSLPGSLQHASTNLDICCGRPGASVMGALEHCVARNAEGSKALSNDGQEPPHAHTNPTALSSCAKHGLLACSNYKSDALLFGRAESWDCMTLARHASPVASLHDGAGAIALGQACWAHSAASHK